VESPFECDRHGHLDVEVSPRLVSRPEQLETQPPLQPELMHVLQQGIHLGFARELLQQGAELGFGRAQLGPVFRQIDRLPFLYQPLVAQLFLLPLDTFELLGL